MSHFPSDGGDFFTPVPDGFVHPSADHDSPVIQEKGQLWKALTAIGACFTLCSGITAGPAFYLADSVLDSTAPTVQLNSGTVSTGYGAHLQRAETQVSGSYPASCVTTTLQKDFDHNGTWDATYTLATGSACPVTKPYEGDGFLKETAKRVVGHLTN